MRRIGWPKLTKQQRERSKLIDQVRQILERENETSSVRWTDHNDIPLYFVSNDELRRIIQKGSTK